LTGVELSDEDKKALESFNDTNQMDEPLSVLAETFGFEVEVDSDATTSKVT
jgi:hypothetical protein